MGEALFEAALHHQRPTRPSMLVTADALPRGVYRLGHGVGADRDRAARAAMGDRRWRHGQLDRRTSGLIGCGAEHGTALVGSSGASTRSATSGASPTASLNSCCSPVFVSSTLPSTQVPSPG